ncbi:probable salivary secreted peptide [Trichogramma pretiosum]|uniref:probable salivary secreted peptide n=1 Tax=Trichogramma pretiosum TaxID=7493 RepID=UPI0006C93FC1|nr:probable salivary secreted peptide [Trichogramma pretiosum]
MSKAACLFLGLLALVACANSTPYYVSSYSSNYNNNNNNGYYAKANQSHNLIMGVRQPGDRLIYQESVVKPSKFLQVIQVEKSFNVSNGYYLTQIRAMDQKTNGNGAFATRVRGGPGYNNVTLSFKSQRGHGINFLVQLYARSRYYH